MEGIEKGEILISISSKLSVAWLGLNELHWQPSLLTISVKSPQSTAKGFKYQNKKLTFRCYINILETAPCITDLINNLILGKWMWQTMRMNGMKDYQLIFSIIEKALRVRNNDSAMTEHWVRFPFRKSLKFPMKKKRGNKWNLGLNTSVFSPVICLSLQNNFLRHNIASNRKYTGPGTSPSL